MHYPSPDHGPAGPGPAGGIPLRPLRPLRPLALASLDLTVPGPDRFRGVRH